MKVIAVSLLLILIGYLPTDTMIFGNFENDFCTEETTAVFIYTEEN